MMSRVYENAHRPRHFVTLALAVLAVTVWLAGCVTTQEVGQRQVHQPASPPAGAGTPPAGENFTPQPLTVQPVEPATPFPATIAQSGANEAVVSLYSRARQEQAAGSFDRAGSDFERAMRLAPRNAFVWSALASLHLQMHQPEQAASEASKSNTLAGGNPYLLHANWLTIAAARAASGDDRGAAAARQQAEKYAPGNTRASGTW